MQLLALLVLAIVPHDDTVLVDRFDLVELNHFYDGEGERVFDQWICYSWNREKGRHQVEHFLLAKPHHHRSGPGLTWLSWQDQSGQLRRVESPIWHETWTQHDPELVDREHYSRERRRGLTLRR